MVPTLVDFGPFAIHSFGVMMALGFLVGGAVIAIDFERNGRDPGHASSIMLWAAIGGLLGARLLVVVVEWRAFLADPIGLLWSGAGFIWYGGLVGGTLAVTIFFRRAGIPWLQGADAAAPALAIGQALGRVGCQISGDGDWGPPSDLPWAMTYPRSVLGWDAWLAANGLAPGTTLHPSPVYETLLYVGIFFVLWSWRRRAVGSGTVFGLYLVLSSLARFSVEMVRVEPVVALGLTQAQWFAMVLASGGLVIVALRRRAVVPA